MTLLRCSLTDITARRRARADRRGRARGAGERRGERAAARFAAGDRRAGRVGGAGLRRIRSAWSGRRRRASRPSARRACPRCCARWLTARRSTSATAHAPPASTSDVRCWSPTPSTIRTGSRAAKRCSRPECVPPGRCRSAPAPDGSSGPSGCTAPTPGLPDGEATELMADAARLAGIAIDRCRSEEALRGSEAKFRGLFESVMEGVYQSSTGGRLISVNPAFVTDPRLCLGRGTVRAAARRDAVLEPGRSRRVRAPARGHRRGAQRGVRAAAARWPADRRARERAGGARRRGPGRVVRGHGRRHHRAQARRAGDLPREGTRPGDAAVDRRCGDHGRRRRAASTT